MDYTREVAREVITSFSSEKGRLARHHVCFEAEARDVLAITSRRVGHNLTIFCAERHVENTHISVLLLALDESLPTLSLHLQ